MIYAYAVRWTRVPASNCIIAPSVQRLMSYDIIVLSGLSFRHVYVVIDRVESDLDLV